MQYNSHTTELANFSINGSSVILYKTETPDFAVIAIIFSDARTDCVHRFFFEEDAEAAARKKYASIVKSIVTDLADAIA